MARIPTRTLAATGIIAGDPASAAQPVAVTETEAVAKPKISETKATLVAWLRDNGDERPEAELTAMTKDQLYEIIDAV